jgi:predicted negative regulator of RcsB-dependent stress response
MTRIPRKELKGPDEFVTLTNRALTYARDNERQVTIIALALLGVLLVALGVRAYRSSQLARAEAAFATAYRQLSEGHLVDAARGFAEVGRSWPSTPQGVLATLYEANAYRDLGKDAEAESAYQRSLTATREPAIRQMALYNLGLVKKKTGNDAEALKYLREAGGLGGPVKAAAWLAAVRVDPKVGQGSVDAEQVAGALPEDARQFFESRIAQ